MELNLTIKSSNNSNTITAMMLQEVIIFQTAIMVEADCQLEIVLGPDHGHLFKTQYDIEQREVPQ